MPGGGINNLRPRLVMPGQTAIYHITISVVVTCRCGSTIPNVVLFVPGLPFITKCTECGIRFRLGYVHYDRSKENNQLQTGIEELAPEVELALAPIPPVS